jgi:shikimate kinase
LGRRLIDADDEFERKAGCSRAQFLKDRRNNAEEYKLQERHVMESMLASNKTDAVIVCGVGSIEAHGQSLLKEYAIKHPVIYVVRETQFIRDWLRIPRDSPLMSRLEESDRRHRLCTNFEFYNLFDGGSNAAEIEGRVSRGESPGQLSPKYAGALQRTQQDFIRFVNLIMGFPDRSLEELLAKISSAAASLDEKVYTYALSVQYSKIALGNIDVMELECGADAIELKIDASAFVGGSLSIESKWVTKLSQMIAALRRHVAAPIIFTINKTSSDEAFGEVGQLSKQEIYFDLLHLGCRLGVEYVTLDIYADSHLLDQLLRTKGSTKVIGDISLEDSRDWEGALPDYQRACLIPCDLVRITKFAKSAEDNVAIRLFNRRGCECSFGHETTSFDCVQSWPTRTSFDVLQHRSDICHASRSQI